MENTEVFYEHNGQRLAAFVAYPKDKREKTPAILIFHAWSGRDEFVCSKAKELAALGYIGIAVDMYGAGVIGANNEENARLMAPFIEDRGLLRSRALKVLEVVKGMESVDIHRIGAMGYCFGGLCALDLARSGTDIKGVVSFHGLLDSPAPLKTERIKPKVLVLNGYDDPMVGERTASNFAKEMKQAAADWQIHHFGGVMHAFTNPMANDPSFGTVYHPLAASRAWAMMKLFFEEVFD